MGQFQQMLDDIIKIESEGFNPYKDSYSARIGELQTRPTTPNPNEVTESSVVAVEDPTVTNPDNVTTTTTTPPNYKETFSGMITPEGKFDLGKFATGFDESKNQPEYLQYTRENYQKEWKNTYGVDPEDKQTIYPVLGETGGLATSKSEKIPKETFFYGESQSQKQDESGKIMYLWKNEKGEHKEFKTKEEFELAKKEYEKKQQEVAERNKKRKEQTGVK